jgi:opacity protein-like surface antigen
MAVHQVLSVVVATTYSRPDWRLRGVPLVGAIDIPGGRLWFGDAALRARTPLGGGGCPLTVFAQAGPGFAHYAVASSVLGTRIDESATNFAVAVGVGAALPITERLAAEVLAKDYIASLKSVRDLAAFGVEGRRAHTVLLAASLRIGL